jgi:hypothetical protein
MEMFVVFWTKSAAGLIAINLIGGVDMIVLIPTMLFHWIAQLLNL